VFQNISCSANQHNDNNNVRGSCLVVELLDLDAINESDDESYCKYYFADLSEANNAVSANTTRIDLKEKRMSFYCHKK
jgi:hypothetical protein